MPSINPWKLFVFGAIGTGIVVNVSFLVLSIRKPSIPVESQPYEAGLKYQQTIDSEREFAKRGWVMTVDQQASPEADTQKETTRSLVFRLQESGGEGVGVNAVSLRAVNPARPDADANVFFLREGEFAWRSSSPLTAGLWLLSWIFEVDGRAFIVNERRVIN